VTKAWKQNLSLLGQIDLILIDEIHHLGDERGYALETILVRMDVLNEEYRSHASENNFQARRYRIHCTCLVSVYDLVV
jgi:hypothetical protein